MALAAMIVRFGCAAILAALASNAMAQDLASLPEVEGPLVRFIKQQKHAAPDSLPDFSETDARMADFRSFAEALARGDWSAAAAMQSQLRYRLARLREGDSVFVVATDDSGSGRDPILVINTTPRTDIIIEAPHVPFEYGTAEQAMMLLRDLRARAAIVSGAHRCAARTFTTCDGRTAVCGTMQAYRASDPAHNTSTLFDVAHRAFSEAWGKSIVISLHGMGLDRNGATSLILSDGALDPDREGTAIATKLRLALDDRKRPGWVVSCNRPGDRSFGFGRLCGHTNVQGRHINGGADACMQSVRRGTGRFIHMEQAPVLRRLYRSGKASAFHRRLVDVLIRVSRR